MMKKFNSALRRVAALTLSVIAVSSVQCAKDDINLQIRRVAVEPVISTRVSGLNFEVNDRIGLTIARASGNYVENKELIFNGSIFAADNLIWYSDMTETSTLMAYYPYAGDGISAGFSIETDQSAGCENSDLLGAVLKDVTPSEAAVKMTFSRLMSQIGSSVCIESEAEITGLVLGGSVPSANVDLATLTATASDAATADVTAYVATKNEAYEAVIVPQTAALTVTVTTADGKSRTEKITSTTFLSGRSYILTITVEREDIKFSLSGDIKDWEEGGELTGDVTGDENSKPNEGSEGDANTADTVTHEGETYTTATIGGKVWMAQNLRHLPEGASIGENVWYPNDSEADVAVKGLLYNYAVATGGATAEPIQGICPEGWHLPTTNDLASLVGATLPEGFLTPAGMETLNGYNSSKNYLLSSSFNGDKCACAPFTETEVSATVEIVKTNGYTVRCVKNE